MPNREHVMKKVLALQDRLATQKNESGDTSGLRRLNRLMSGIKRAGIVEEIRINGSKGNYLVIEGNSWQDVCRSLGIDTAPNFVMWEEADFLSFLDMQLAASSKDGVRRAVAAPSHRAKPARRVSGKSTQKTAK